jgi:hypothetical protein
METDQDVCRNIYYEELAHLIMEAEKSHNLSTVSWRLRTAGGAIHNKSKGLRTRGTGVINPSPKKEDGCFGSSSEAGIKRGEFLLPLLFVLFRALNGLDEAHPTYEG